jgi:hypothetical protein
MAARSQAGPCISASTSGDRTMVLSRTKGLVVVLDAVVVVEIVDQDAEGFLDRTELGVAEPVDPLRAARRCRGESPLLGRCVTRVTAAASGRSPRRDVPDDGYRMIDPTLWLAFVASCNGRNSRSPDSLAGAPPICTLSPADARSVLARAQSITVGKPSAQIEDIALPVGPAGSVL